MEILRNIIKTAQRELIIISKSKMMLGLLILIPAAIFFVMINIYRFELVRDLPVAVCDNDNSATSRLITRYLDAASSMKITEKLTSLNEIKEAFRNGKIEGAVYFPQNFEKDVKSSGQSTVVFYKNTANIIVGNLLFKDASTVVKTVSAGVVIKKLRSKGFGYERSLNVANPIKIETQSLYNPNYSYLTYLVPGVLTCTLQMIIMLGSILVINSEFKNGTFGELYLANGKNSFVLLAGKMFPYTIYFLFLSFLTVFAVMPLVGISPAGSAWKVVFLIIPFVLACQVFGIFLSALIKNEIMSVETVLIFNTPCFIFSGFTFPLWSMPAIHNIFAQLMPFTHFLYGFLDLFQMDVPFSNAIPEMLRLLLFIIILFPATYFLVRYEGKKIVEAGLQQDIL